jgi:hypothetical protein
MGRKLTGVATRRQNPWSGGNRWVGYDLERRRVWVGGQRLHHGVTGLAMASTGVLRLTWRRRLARRRALAWTLAGGALIAHDWNDRTLWFQRGSQAR